VEPVPTLLILGASGHGRVVADAALCRGGWTVIYATDRDPARCAGELVPGVALMEPEAALQAASAVHVAIGDARARRNEAIAAGVARLATVVHPHASVSAFATVGAGCFIAARAVVAPAARLGLGVIVNHGAVVDHDVVVEDYSHIAPGATLGGAVRVGSLVLIGAGASVLPGLRICDGAVIGAGAVVRQDVTQPGVYAGVPARRIQ